MPRTSAVLRGEVTLMTKGKGKENTTEHSGQEPAGEPPVSQGDTEADVVTLPVEEFERLLKQAGERDEYLEMAKRAKADFANYRKRAEREAAQACDEATAEFAKSLLPVIDNLDRAIASAEKEHDFQALLEGIRLVTKEMLKTLASFGIEAIEARGTTFDPSRHEAVFGEATEEAAPHTVLDELHRGYLFKGKLLRPSAVTVAVLPDAAPPSESPETAETPGEKEEE